MSKLKNQDIIRNIKHLEDIQKVLAKGVIDSNEKGIGNIVNGVRFIAKQLHFTDTLIQEILQHLLDSSTE